MATPRGTLVRLVHSGWERLAQDDEAERAAYDSGWQPVLRRFTEAAAGVTAAG